MSSKPVVSTTKSTGRSVCPVRYSSSSGRVRSPRRIMRHIAFCAVALACAAPAVAAEPSAFATLADKYWDEELARSPAFATQMGIHRYDDQLIDLSAPAIKKYAAAQKEWLRKFGAIDTTRLSRDEAIDLQIVEQQARSAIVEIEVYRRWRRLP